MHNLCVCLRLCSEQEQVKIMKALSKRKGYIFFDMIRFDLARPIVKHHYR